MSGITLVNQVKASKFLSGILQPVANAFVNAAGYRKLGVCPFLFSIFPWTHTFTIYSERVSCGKQTSTTKLANAGSSTHTCLVSYRMACKHG
jgi:hypothetical protein